MSLKQTFSDLLAKYTNDQDLALRMWQEIEDYYGSAQRLYHNLQHIEDMLNKLSAVKEEIEDWDTLVFALFYHDIVYSVPAFDNEIRSADLACKRLQELGLATEKVERCRQHILATQRHWPVKDCDTKYFMDADLSIWGEDWERYKDYASCIRKEYARYSDKEYSEGRRNALLHFLGRNRIFTTEHFYAAYEQQARINLKRELNELAYA